MSMIGFLYQRLRWQSAIWLLLIIVAVTFDSLSIGLLLPLVSEPESDSPLVNLVYRLFAAVGIEYSLVSAIAFIACVYAARTLISLTQRIVAAKNIAKFQTDAKFQTVDNISRLDYQFFSRSDAGVLNNAVSLEFNNMATALGHLTHAVASGLLSLGMLLLAFIIEPQLAVVALAILVPGYFGMKKAAGFLHRLSNENTANNGVIQASVTQILVAFKYLRASGTNDRAVGRLRCRIRTQGRLLYAQMSAAAALSNSIDLALVFALLGFVLLYTGVMDRSLLEAVFILVIIRRGVSYGIQGQERFQQFLELSGSIRLFQKLERELPEHEEPVGKDTVQPDFSQPIRFQDVSFGYSNSAEVLKGLNLTIPPNSRVAIVGSSGSGKSTLVAMLTGLLRPTSGVIAMGDTPYGDIDQAALRSSIGYMTQENVIFNDSVANNVSLWDPAASADRVRRALKSSASWDFVERLPGGVDTVIGDDGARLSGGQRQRIAIARELYKKPALLICDEGMSALDSETESSILSKIDEIRGTATLVLVAHRLSTTRNCDLVYVVEDGRVVERGRYDELYAAGGTFREMVDRQSASGRLFEDASVAPGSHRLSVASNSGMPQVRERNLPE